MNFRIIIYILFLILIMIVSFSCSNDDSSNNSLNLSDNNAANNPNISSDNKNINNYDFNKNKLSLLTHLTKSTIKVGEVTNFSCKIQTDNNNADVTGLLKSDYTDEELLIGANWVLALKKGTYKLHCYVPEQDLEDLEGAELTVSTNPGIGENPELSSFLEVNTILEQGQIYLSETADMHCLLRSLGVSIGEVDGIAKVVPEGRAVINNKSIMPLISGDYSVACFVEQYNLIDNTPANLIVLDNPNTGFSGSFSIDTEIMTTTAEVGEPIYVNCNIYEDENLLGEILADLDITPINDVILGENWFTASAPGDYSVSCKHTALNIFDETPAFITVTGNSTNNLQNNEEQLELITMLTAYTIKVGETVGVDCMLKQGTSELGNVDAEIQIDPLDGIVKGDGWIQVQNAGNYQISCFMSETGLLDETPAILTVEEAEIDQNPDDNYNIDTVLNQYQSETGEAIYVTCILSRNNQQLGEIESDFTVTPRQGIQVGENWVIPLIEGTYEIACKNDSQSVVDNSPSILQVSNSTNSEPDFSVETLLSSYEVIKGEKVYIKCMLYNNGIEVGESPASIIIEPQNGVVQGEGWIKGVETGVYEITCSVDNLAVVDETPAILTVNENPDPAITNYVIETELDKNAIVVGESVHVSCILFENGVETGEVPAEIVVTPSANVFIGNGIITPGRTGSYIIFCKHDDLGISDTTPSELEVSVFEPDTSPVITIDTILSSNEVFQGELVNVTCILYENGIEVGESNANIQVQPAGTSLTGDNWVVINEPGEYNISCHLGVYGVLDESPALLNVKPEDDSTNPDPSLPINSVDTVINETVIEVGNTAQVFCKLYKDNILFGEIPAEIIVSPQNGGLIVGAGWVSGASEGQYEVSCSLPVLGIVDESPALINVVSDPNSATNTTVETELNTFNSVEGEVVFVECWLYQNGIVSGQIEGEITVTPPDGIFTGEDWVVGTEAGVYEIGCNLPDLGIKDETPEQLTVTESSDDNGNNVSCLYEVDTILSSATTFENESVHVGCMLYCDGILVGETPGFITADPLENLIIGEGWVLGKEVGEYNITCNVSMYAVSDTSPAILIVNEDPNSTGPDPQVEYTIDTELSETSIAAGLSVDVSCVLYENGVRSGYLASNFNAVPAMGLDIGEGWVAGINSGEYEIACKNEDLNLIDETPSVLEILAGAPSHVETELDMTNIIIGAEVEGICKVYDTQNNELTAEETQLIIRYCAGGCYEDPSTFVLVDNNHFVPSLEGYYEVACRSVDYPIEDQSPVSLVVSQGTVVFVDTILHSTEVKAGDSLEVECKLLNENNYPVSGNAKLLVEPTGDVTLNNLTLTITNIGDYDIYCYSPMPLLMDNSPAKITVIPGDAYSLKPLLSTDKLKAGEVVKVDCELSDYYGNIINESMLEFGINPNNAGVSSVQDGFEITEANDYAISCNPGNYTLTNLQDAYLKVEPAFPNKINMAVSPNDGGAIIGSFVYISYDIRDRYDNWIADDIINFSVLPPLGISIVDKYQVRIDTEGIFTLTATVLPPVDESICGNSTGCPLIETFEVRADGSGPEIKVLTPLRAAMLTGNHQDKITVNGTVSDKYNAVSELWIQGSQIPFNPVTGEFTYEQVSYLGANIIDIEAYDLLGNGSKSVQTYLMAKEYLPYTGNVEADRINKGLGVRIGQSLLDDDDLNDVDDFATIVHNAMNNTNMMDYIENPIYEKDFFVCDVRANIDYITWNKNSLSEGIMLKDGGISLSMDMTDFKVGISGSCIPDGYVLANYVLINAELAVTSNGERVDVILQSTNVTINNMDFHLSGILDWVLELLESPIANALEDAIEDTIRDQIEPMLEDIFASLVFEGQFDMPEPMNASLQYSAKFTDAEFSYAGGMLGMATSFSTAKGITTNPPGSMSFGFCYPESIEGKAVGMGLLYDALNQALFAGWWSGASNISIGADSGPGGSGINYEMDNVSGTVTPLLPPIIYPRGFDSENPLELVLGDVEIKLTADLGGIPIDVKAYVTAIAIGGVFLEDNKVKISISNEMTLFVEISPLQLVGIPLPSQGYLSIYLEEIIKAVLPTLVEPIIEEIELPVFDLSAMGGEYGIQPGTVWGIGNAITSYQGCYLTFEGDIVNIGP